MDLAKAHVIAKRVGKVISNESFSLRTNTLHLATIEVKANDNDVSIMFISSSSGGGHA